MYFDMKINFLLLALGFGCPLLVNCSNEHNIGKAGSNIYFISPKNLPAVKRTASAGNGADARRLFYFYDFIESDRDEAMKWLHKAADLNDPLSQYILGQFYLTDSSMRDLGRAKFLLSAAKDNGCAKAEKLLKTLDNNSK